MIVEVKFNKTKKNEISGLDIRKAISLNIWGDKINAGQIMIHSISFSPFEYRIDFKLKSEGKKIFSINLKYGKVVEKKSPQLRLL